MIADEFTEQLSAYIDDELATAERLAVERHLASCPACQADMAALSALVMALRALPSIPAPAGVEARALGVIARRAARAARLRGLGEALRRHARSYALACSGLAAAAVVLAILPVDRVTQPRQTPAVPTSPATPPSRPLSGPASLPAAPPAGPTAAIATPPTARVAPQPEAAPGEPRFYGSARGAGMMGTRSMSGRPGLSRFNGASTTDGQWNEIAAANADSIVRIDAEWRLYDAATQRPVFQKVLRNPQGGLALAFVRLKSGKPVRWLTLDDDGGRNAPIQGFGHGEGFLADDQGDVLTSKSLVAGWAVRFDDPTGAAMIVDEGAAALHHPSGVALDAATLGDAEAWTPTSGGYLFAGDAPAPIAQRPSAFVGRNVKLHVLVGTTDDGASSRIAGLSADADIARLRLDPPPKAQTMAIAQGEPLPIGKQILVLGGLRLSSWRTTRHAEALDVQMNAVTASTAAEHVSTSETEAQRTPIAEDAVRGLLGRVGLPVFGNAERPARYGLLLGGGGDEAGSPVLDQDGKVVGLLTEAGRPGDPHAGYVMTTIRYGLELLPPGAALAKASPNASSTASAKGGSKLRAQPDGPDGPQP